MGLFNKRNTAAFAAGPDIKAATGGSYVGSGQIGDLYSYTVGSLELRAMQVPTISRARDLIASMVACLDFRQYTLSWNGAEGEYDKMYLPGESWMTRPDPKVTRNFLIANTVSDLFHYGRCTWYITSRYSTGFPASFQWLPFANTSFEDQAGPQWFGPSKEILFNGVPINPDDTVQFLSPNMGVVYMGATAIDIATRLDAAARRFASNEIAAGYLQQKGGEPMTADELAEMAAGWSSARARNAIGALNEYVEFKEFSSDPSKLQLVESRQHAALELARVANIPPYLVGVAVGGYTYQNAQQARQDLYLFGAKPFIDCIQETLSMDNVLARDRHVEFDLDDYLGDNGLVDSDLVAPDMATVDNGD